MRKRLVIQAILVLLFSMYGQADALCVKVSKANLRSGPGTHYEKTWEVYKYMPFKKLKKEGNWYRVEDVDQDVHWIYQTLVTDKFNCAVVKVEKANVRTGPGTQYAKKYYNYSLKYDSYRVLERKGQWVKVRDELGDEGWIFRKLLWIY